MNAWIEILFTYKKSINDLKDSSLPAGKPGPGAVRPWAVGAGERESRDEERDSLHRPQRTGREQGENTTLNRNATTSTRRGTENLRPR